VLGLTERDITLAVPKLFFARDGIEICSFHFRWAPPPHCSPKRAPPRRCSPRFSGFGHRVGERADDVNQMVTHPEAPSRTSRRCVFRLRRGSTAVELYERWNKTFGVELLDGLGTAEMWHIFISNSPVPCARTIGTSSRASMSGCVTIWGTI